MKKTFDSKVIGKIDDNFFYDYYDNDENGLEEFADSMNENRKDSTKEITDNT